MVHLLIISDDALARAGLATLLADRPDLYLIGQLAADPARIDTYQPDVILWDLGWEPEFTALQELTATEPAPPVLALLPDDSFAAEARAAGAHSLLLRQTSPAQLLPALLATAERLHVIAPELMAALSPGFASPPAPLPEPLTPRELEVLQHLAEGLPNKSIARRLAISEHTVKFHITAIMGKLNAQSRTEAVVRATQLGLVLL